MEENCEIKGNSLRMLSLPKRAQSEGTKFCFANILGVSQKFWIAFYSWNGGTIPLAVSFLILSYKKGFSLKLETFLG